MMLRHNFKKTLENNPVLVKLNELEEMKGVGK